MSGQGYEQLTLFPVDSHASRSVLPGSEEAHEMTVTSGQRCLELYRKSGRVGLLAKMLLDSSAWSSPFRLLEWRVELLTEHRTLTIMRRYGHDRKKCYSWHSSENLKAWDTKSKHLLFRLVPLEPDTEETDLLLWATPNTMDYLPQRSPEALLKQATTSRKGRRRPANLREQVNENTVDLWPTPTTDSATDRQKKYAQGGMPLSVAVKMWPTPTAAQCGMTARTSGRPIEKSTHLQTQVYLEEKKRVLLPTPTARAGKAPSNTETRQGAPALQTVAGGQLNPLWVEWLMGFPIGWTDLNASETR